MFSASFFSVKWFFLKKNQPLQVHLEGGGGGRPKTRFSVSNRALQPFRGEGNQGFQAAENRQGKPERLPSFRSDDSIEGAELNRTALRKQERTVPFS